MILRAVKYCRSTMPKRALASPTASPAKKKGKVTGHQYSLDRFFGGSSSSPGPTPTPPNRPTKGKAKPTSETSQQSNADEKRHHSSGARGVSSLGHDSDATLAWSLAEEEGLDLDKLKELEESARRNLTRRYPAAPVEIIDVDSLSDQGTPAAPGPSIAGPSRIRVDVSLASPKDPGHQAVGEPGAVASPTPVLGGSHQDSSADPVYERLDVDPVLYVVLDKIWRPGRPAPYSFLAYTLATLSGTRSRIAILNTLTNCLRTITRHHPSSLLPALYLLSNSLSPPYSPLELGLGGSTISKAIQHVSGLSASALKRLYNTTGDPGDVAFEAKSNVRTLIPHPPLLVTGVYESLLKIARAKGQGAAKQKQSLVEKLLVAAKGEETRYLVRTLCQNLRVGAVRTSLLTALARAMVLTPPPGVISAESTFTYYVTSEQLAQVDTSVGNAKKKVADPARDGINAVLTKAEGLLKRVYVQHPNYDDIVKALLEVGLDGLASHVPLSVGIPLLPTLGSPTRSLDEIYDRLSFLPFTAEFKYDGQRAQMHVWRESGRISVKIFSRHLEDMTDKYPDIVSLAEHMFEASAGTDSFILDSEIVAIDPTDGRLKSFQELSNRARKDVRIEDVKVAVCVYAFDIMYLDGEILLQKPFRERRALLRTRFPPYIPERRDAARFSHVQSCESEDGRDIVEEFWQAAVASSCEGLMIKLLDSGEVLEEVNQKERPRRKPLPATYEPDKRTSAWLKLKKDYVTGLGDSLDLVPIGAWHGNGRKAQWWSPILLAVWDASAGKLVAVCKCMSGFTDVFYKSLKERYPEQSETCSPQPLWEPACETGGLKPEVYFKPQEVWEIRGADITMSPVSVAALGLVNLNRGLSLRFPRFIRVREDKMVENASTPEFLAQMYRDQDSRGKDSAGADDGDLIDVYQGSSGGEDQSEDSDEGVS
ncbi:ATP-dependent DNA ligase [Daedalea quercina L-15889]|uniref:DNA ligase n=1 Tax=Daedalea quercina L-15889 TaxID=1314783 RepID=A0A165RNL1_9APHY|nr:ATP-dependent DNA ligase [Daedalea quercina L-15889]